MCGLVITILSKWREGSYVTRQSGHQQEKKMQRTGESRTRTMLSGLGRSRPKMNPHGAPHRSLSSCPTLTTKKDNPQKSPRLIFTIVIFVYHIQSLCKLVHSAGKSSRIKRTSRKARMVSVYLVMAMDPTRSTVKIDPASPSKI